MVGEVGLAGAIGVHHVYLKVAVAVGVERDLCAVVRPGWLRVIGGGVGESGLARANWSVWPTGSHPLHLTQAYGREHQCSVD